MIPMGMEWAFKKGISRCLMCRTICTVFLGRFEAQLLGLGCVYDSLTAG